MKELQDMLELQEVEDLKKLQEVLELQEVED